MKIIRSPYGCSALLVIFFSLVHPLLFLHGTNIRYSFVKTRLYDQQTIIARQYSTPDINCTALPILIPAYNTYFIILRKDNYDQKLSYARHLKNMLSNLRVLS